MKYLLDTNILIDHIRGRHTIDRKFLEEGVSISIITLGELIHGAYKSENSRKSLASIEYTLKSLTIDVEQLDEKIIHEFGRMKATLEKSGERLEDFDLLIAATARVFELELITRNIRHFSRIKGLKIHEFNPN